MFKVMFRVTLRLSSMINEMTGRLESMVNVNMVFATDCVPGVYRIIGEITRASHSIALGPRSGQIAMGNLFGWIPQFVLKYGIDHGMRIFQFAEVMVLGMEGLGGRWAWCGGEERVRRGITLTYEMHWKRIMMLLDDDRYRAVVSLACKSCKVQ